MRTFKRAGLMFLFMILTVGVALAGSGANGAGWSITLNTPAANGTYAPSATIGAYSGRASWAKGDDTIDMIAMYVLEGGSNPNTATTDSSNYANWNKTVNQDGSGSGTFNSQNVTPALTAPPNFNTDFNIVAIPENAARGAYYTDNNRQNIFGDSHAESTTKN